MAKDLDLEMDEEDVKELIEEHQHVLTSEELKVLVEQKHKGAQRKISWKENDRGPIRTAIIKKLLKWEEVQTIAKQWHQNEAEVNSGRIVQ